MKTERWTLTLELPPEASAGDRGGRFMARLLKHLLRAWGCRCVAHAMQQEKPSQPETPAGEIQPGEK